METVEKAYVKEYVERIRKHGAGQSEAIKRNGAVKVDLQKFKLLGRFKLKVLKEIHREFNEYLLEEFGKDFNEYKKHLARLKKDSIFECISIIEGVSQEEVWGVFEKIVLQKREAYRQKRVPDFLYFYDRDDVSESFVERLSQNNFIVLKETYIPFSFLSVEEDDVPEERYVDYGRLVIVFTRNVRESVSLERDASRGQKVFERIMGEAVCRRASDVHVVPGVSSYYVYFREDGFFRLQKRLTLSFEEAESFVVYMMRRAAEEVGGKFNPDTRLAYQDARISVPEGSTLWGKNFDLRLAFIPDGTPRSKLEVCMRILYKDDEMTSSVMRRHGEITERLKALGYLEEDVRILKNILYKRNGIVIVSGITNSGKSTLVSNLLAGIKDKKIGTIEDPIEYYVDSPNYVQHQLFISDQEKISMDFVDYVKAFKRSDYDIVFVGEWRNHEGLTEALLEQAYAGQLIFTTLHVGSSFQVLKGLESVFRVNIEELKPILLLSWNQVLVPRLCPECKKKVKVVSVSADTLEVCKTFPGITDDMIKQLENFVIRDGYVRGEGCEKCRGKGYLGRQVVYDYFLPTVDFWERLGDDYSHYNVMKAARIKKTKIDTFLQMVALGVVDVNDVHLVL